MAAKTLTDLSLQQQTGTTEDDDVVESACEDAADHVESFLGSVSETDKAGLRLGVRLALWYLSSSYRGGQTEAAQATLAQIEADLDRERMARVQEAAIPVVYEAD